MQTPLPLEELPMTFPGVGMDFILELHIVLVRPPETEPDNFYCANWSLNTWVLSRDGTVVRALASHQVRDGAVVRALASHQVRDGTVVRALTSHQVRDDTVVRALASHQVRDGTVVGALAFHQCGLARFDSWTRHHMWVEYVVGSLLALRGFCQLCQLQDCYFSATLLKQSQFKYACNSPIKLNRL